MPNVLTLESNKYAIRINNFEGPLDLLCTLIEKNKMNIYDINLNEITDQYIKYIDILDNKFSTLKTLYDLNVSTKKHKETVDRIAACEILDFYLRMKGK